MELYVLDSNFQKTDVVDSYETLIWTERYSESGDVTLVFPQIGPANEIVHEGTYVAIDGSIEVCQILDISIEDGVVTATGKTLVDFFKQRIFRDTWQTTKSSWTLLGYSAGIWAASIVAQMVSPGGLMATGQVEPTDFLNEIIPTIHAGSVADGGIVNADIPYGNLYDAVKALCDLDSLGFRLYPQDPTSSSGSILFDTYRGLDRTSGQSTNPLVVFESALDSLINIKELRSIQQYKTAAYAWASQMTAQSSIGYATVPGSSLSGFARRTLMVDATDITAANYSSADLKTILNQRAADALINNNYVRTTDGTIVPQSPYRYGAHYSLGDIIELRGTSNNYQKARVTEYIRAQDSTGYTEYPTLALIS